MVFLVLYLFFLAFCISIFSFIYTLSHKPPEMDEPPKKKINPENLRLYALALNNRWTKRVLYHHVAPNIPIFVYCSLMLPWVLARVLGAGGADGVERTTAIMTRGTLRHHFRVTMKHTNTPTVVKTKEEAAVDGILIGKVGPQAVARIEEYVGIGQHSMEIIEVEVMTKEGKQVTVYALVYVWNGPKEALEAKNWTPMKYMRSMADVEDRLRDTE